MAVRLGTNQYGKAEVRLVRITRATARHEIQDLTVTSQLRGDFGAAHTAGDNSRVIPTDTQKNTVYGLAKELGIASIEEFALALGAHFTTEVDGVTGGRWAIDQHAWRRIDVGGREHDHAFSRDASERRTTVVVLDGGQRHVVSGISDLTVLKTTGSGFSGFPRDRFTTLAETDDRILATEVTARWRYAGSGAGGAEDVVDYDAAHADVRRILLETFAREHSLALQQTLFQMGEAVLDAHPEIAELRLSMPNKHHFLVDLSPFGLENEDEVYVAADRPYGLIEATVLRDDTEPAPAAWDGTPGPG